jgi:hypothetical protein
MVPDGRFPGGKRFAFTIMDDTDVATLANVEPVYRLLESLGMRTTKTVWPLPCPEGSADFAESQTLADPEYRDFLLDLARRGFEMASHGATMESSERGRTLEAFEVFHRTFGYYPRVHSNHGFNQENVYWGAERFDHPVIRAVALATGGGGPYEGHLQRSRFWWGDVCHDRIAYVRNLTFSSLNVLRINPSMPYHDPRRPLVRWWFSAADAQDRGAFVELLNPRAQDRLERESGACIVATHFGKGFARDGRVHAGVERLLKALARRDGWFPTVGELLDYLRARRKDDHLPPSEWRRMQWRWLWDLGQRRVRRPRSG